MAATNSSLDSEVIQFVAFEVVGHQLKVKGQSSQCHVASLDGCFDLDSANDQLERCSRFVLPILFQPCACFASGGLARHFFPCARVEPMHLILVFSLALVCAHTVSFRPAAL